MGMSVVAITVVGKNVQPGARSVDVTIVIIGICPLYSTLCQEKLVS